MMTDVEHLFMYVFLGETSIQDLHPFFNWVVCFVVEKDNFFYIFCLVNLMPVLFEMHPASLFSYLDGPYFPVSLCTL